MHDEVIGKCNVKGLIAKGSGSTSESEDGEENVQQPLILTSSVKLDSLRNDLTNKATRLSADITEIPNKATCLVMGQIAKWRLGSSKDWEETQDRNIKGTKKRS